MSSSSGSSGGFWAGVLAILGVGAAAYVVTQNDQRALLPPRPDLAEHKRALAVDTGAFALSKASDDLSESGERDKTIPMAAVRRALGNLVQARDELLSIAESDPITDRTDAICGRIDDLIDTIESFEGKIPQPAAAEVAEDARALWLACAKVSASIEPQGAWGYATAL